MIPADPEVQLIPLEDQNVRFVLNRGREAAPLISVTVILRRIIFFYTYGIDNSNYKLLMLMEEVKVSELIRHAVTAMATVSFAISWCS